MEIYEKILYLRKQQNLSQEALAERLSVSRQAVSKWEAGQSKPDLDNIVSLSNIFQVSADYLIKKDMDEPRPNPPIIPSRFTFTMDWRFLCFFSILLNVVGILVIVLRH